MRISDWSSDVCSSDLIADATGWPQALHGSLQYGTRQGVHLDVHRLPWLYARQLGFAEVGCDVDRIERDHRQQRLASIHECADAHRLLADHAADGRRDSGIGKLRSAERRVGKEGVSTCRSRWST